MVGSAALLRRSLAQPSATAVVGTRRMAVARARLCGNGPWSTARGAAGMAREPIDRQLRHLLEGSRLLKKVPRSGEHFQPASGRERFERGSVEFPDQVILATHDE